MFRSTLFYRAAENAVHAQRALDGRRDYLHILFGDLPKEALE